jgi:hypothetical protein
VFVSSFGFRASRFTETIMRIHQLQLPFLAFCMVTATALAGDPQISTLAPYGLQRGVETTLTITGSGLATAKELLFYEPGFTVKSLEAVKEDTLKVTIATTADCELGTHALRIRSLGGVSNLRMFTVGNLPETAEKEPNNSREQAQLVPLNITVSGVVASEDVDHFAVELKRGDRLNVELEGLRIHSISSASFFDPTLAILGPDGSILAKSDDAAFVSQDCLASLVAPADGRYVVQLRDVAYGGSASCTYRLHVGTFPRPVAVYPPGGRPGETLAVQWIGDAAGPFEQQITLPTTADAEARLVARDVHGEAPSPNIMRVSDLAWTNELEPNDELKAATAATALPFAVHGIIERPGDADFFKFTAKKGQSLEFRVIARKPLRSPLDALLSVHNDKGATVASNDDTGGPDSFIRFAIPADGDYFLSVRDQLKAGSPEFVYRVEVTATAPTLTVRLPEQRRYISTTLVVPQGNRNAVMVGAQRQNFGGELAFSFENLPPGMTAELLPMTAGQQEIPVLFTASADAEPAGALVGITGKATDLKLNVVGHLDQRTMLVRGQNNVDVWGHNADRMATVLAAKIPYSIEIVPPKAPLVRNGSIQLKVVAHRDEGFKDQIGLRLLYNPPGVASSGYVTIPEGKDEAVIPLTANNGAGLGTWKICVTGRSGTFGRRGGGQFGPDESHRCSTQFADLKVEDMYHKLSFVKAAVEQGAETTLTVKVQKLKDFAGTAKAELAGLPANTKTEPVEFTQDTEELKFKVTAAKSAKPGRFTSVVCVTRIPLADAGDTGEAITHTISGGELRVDAPLKK